MDPLLERLSTSVTSAKTVEDLTRPLLEMLESVTGLESTYLTVIDLDQGVQRILYARNTRQLQIPEGLSVPWADTLCKRALDAKQPFTDDVGGCWGDSDAARALGIQTYLSTPVRMENGALYGTLCAASAERHSLNPQAQRLLGLFATLIGQHVERELLVQRLVHANERLAAYATTDPLTELPNRRALHQALTRLLAQGARRGTSVLIAFIDLDGFKAINDTHGHDIGDAFLTEFAERLRSALRTEDLATRLGGDEFVVIGPGPDNAALLPAAKLTLQTRLFQATVGSYQLEGIKLAYPGASIGVISGESNMLDATQALKLADAAMYEVKRARKAVSSTHAAADGFAVVKGI